MNQSNLNHSNTSFNKGKSNGIFKRNPEPKTENLKDVAKKVLEHSADLGFSIANGGNYFSDFQGKNITFFTF